MLNITVYRSWTKGLLEDSKISVNQKCVKLSMYVQLVQCEHYGVYNAHEGIDFSHGPYREIRMGVALRRATPPYLLKMAQSEAARAFRSLWLDLHDQLMCLETLTPMLLSLRDDKIIDHAMQRRMMRSDLRDADVDQLLTAMETKLTFSPESLDHIVKALRKIPTLSDLAAQLERPGKSATEGSFLTPLHEIGPPFV